jgi:hypothetical protein
VFHVRIKPGDYVMVRKEKSSTETLPCEVQQIRYVDTKNGASAVAVVVEIDEMPTARVVELTVINLDLGVDFECEEAVSMADPKLISDIQENLKNQREHMRLAIQASLQAPRQLSFGSKGSGASREKQNERAKRQREELKNMRENALAAKMAESNCTREEAMKYFTDLAAKQGG